MPTRWRIPGQCRGRHHTGGCSPGCGQRIIQWLIRCHRRSQTFLLWLTLREKESQEHCQKCMDSLPHSVPSSAFEDVGYCSELTECRTENGIEKHEAEEHFSIFLSQSTLEHFSIFLSQSTLDHGV